MKKLLLFFALWPVMFFLGCESDLEQPPCVIVEGEVSEIKGGATAEGVRLILRELDFGDMGFFVGKVLDETVISGESYFKLFSCEDHVKSGRFFVESPNITILDTVTGTMRSVTKYTELICNGDRYAVEDFFLSLSLPSLFEAEILMVKNPDLE